MADLTATAASVRQMVRRTWLQPRFVLIVGLLLSALTYYVARIADDAHILSLLTARLDLRTGDLKYRLDNLVTPARSLAIFVGTEPNASSAEIRRAAGLFQAGMQSMSVVTLRWAPRGARTGESFPVAAEQLGPGASSRTGADLFADPARRAVLEAARDEAVAKSMLLRSETGDVALLLYVPAYRGGKPPATPPERRAALLGYVAGEYDLNSVFSAGVENTPALNTPIEIFVGPKPTVLPADAVSQYLPGRGFTAPRQIATFSSPSMQSRSFEALGQIWTLRFDPAPLVAQVRSQNPLIYFAGAIVLTLLATLYLRREQRDRSALKANEAKLLGFLTASPDVLMIVDETGRIVLASRLTEDTFGYAPSDLVGKPLELLVPDLFRVANVAKLRSIMRDPNQRGSTGLEVQALRKDGTEFPSELFLSSHQTTDGIALIAAIRDISKRKQAEEALAQAQRMEGVGQLTGGIAHDFNNVLGAVIGNLDMLTDLVADQPKVARYAEMSLAAALSGAELVKRLSRSRVRSPCARSRSICER